MEVAVIVLLVAVLAFILGLHLRLSNPPKWVDQFKNDQSHNSRELRDELTRDRAESRSEIRQNREELGNSFKALTDSLLARVAELITMQKGISDRHDALSSSIHQQFGAFLTELSKNRESAAASEKQARTESANTLQVFQQTMRETIKESSNTTKESLEAFSKEIKGLAATSELSLEKMRKTVEERLDHIQKDNSEKLEKMRATVSEKLESTLERRVGESFRLVSERLEQVHKGLGEMQSLAIGVGDLKKVLTNVRARGTWGEAQLGALLEQFLSPEQYASNVAVKKGSREMVEYAIKLPGTSETPGEHVWLPIDAKFPIEDYHRLVAAAEVGNPIAVEAASKQLEETVAAEAKKICDKYINPPVTTDFAVMFLPTESLYAEVLRLPGLQEALHRDCRVMLAGPANLAALLNCLQMGFRSLTVQKRSSEVWQLLGDVKSDFGIFGDLLEKTKKKLTEATNSIDSAAQKTRGIERKLKNVQTLPQPSGAALLSNVQAMASLPVEISAPVQPEEEEVPF